MQKKEIFDTLKEMAGMRSEDYIYYCVKLRSLSAGEVQEKVELVIRSVSRIRKEIYYRNH